MVSYHVPQQPNSPQRAPPPRCRNQIADEGNTSSRHVVTCQLAVSLPSAALVIKDDEPPTLLCNTSNGYGTSSQRQSQPVTLPMNADDVALPQLAQYEQTLNCTTLPGGAELETQHLRLQLEAAKLELQHSRQQSASQIQQLHQARLGTDELRAKTECAVCFDGERDAVLFPCMHSCCYACSQVLEICPNCRVPVTGVSRILSP